VLVYLTLPAASPGLRQGLFAQGILETGEMSALAVPLDTVRTDKPKPYVQIIRDGHVHLVPVQMGARGTLRSAARAADHNEIWVTVKSLDATGAPAGKTAASIGIEPNTWVLRSTVGALNEGTAIKLPQPQ
jgi:hypothetical protein